MQKKPILFEKLPDEVQLEVIMLFPVHLTDRAYAVPVEFERGFEIDEDDFWVVDGELYAMVMAPSFGRIRTSTQRVLNKRREVLCISNKGFNQSFPDACVATYSATEVGTYRWRFLFAL